MSLKLKTDAAAEAPAAAARPPDGGSSPPSPPPPDLAAEAEAKTPRGGGLLARAAAAFHHHPRLALGVGALAVAGALALYAATSGYELYLFFQAKRDFEAGRYADAAGKLSAYYARDSEDTEAALLLAKAQLYRGDEEAADQLLERLANQSAAAAADPSLFHYRALVGVVRRDVAEIRRAAVQALAIDETYFPTRYVLALAHLQDAAAGDDEIARLGEQLDNWQRRVPADKAEEYEREINTARRLFFERYPLRLFNASSPLAFSRLSAETTMTKLLGFPLPVGGFYNVYYVPLRDSSAQAESLSLEDSVALFHVLSALLRRRPEAAESALQRMSRNSALLWLYSRAYLAALNGNYSSASLTYKRIIDDHGGDNPHANLMFANAEWAGRVGGLPADNVLAAYGASLAATDDGNVFAFNNLAFMLMYRGELAEAREMLDRGREASPQDGRMAFNLALLDIAEGRLADAEAKLRGLDLETAPAAATETLAHVLVAAQKHSEAARVLRAARDTFGPIRIRLAIVDVYRDVGDSDLAINELRAGLEENPDNVDLVAELLLEQAAADNIEAYSRSILVHQDVIGKSGNDYRVLLSEALATKSAERSDLKYEQAVNNAVDVAQKNKVVAYQARALAKSDRRDDALAVLREHIADFGGNVGLRALALRLRAEIGVGEDEREAALAATTALFADNPRMSPIARVDIAWAFLGLGAPERSVEIVNGLGNMRFVVEGALSALRDAYIAVDEVEKAEDIARRYGDAVGSSSEAAQAARAAALPTPVIFGASTADLNRRLNEAVNEDDYETAVAIYTEILERDVRRREPGVTYQNRGAAYLRLEKHEEAAEDFAKALTYDMTDEQARGAIHYNYGYALAQLGRWEESEKQLRSRLEFRPNDLRSLHLLAQILRQQERYEDVVATYEALLEHHPRELQAYTSLAKVYLILNNPEDLVRTLNRALEVDPKNVNLHRQLAEAYFSIGATEQARRHMEIIKNL